ncbi:thioredoxin-like 4, chloroplastic isoform X2 [Miscanthus floridulus]|uniref:thioredoxin-like 4, chloroplastic isoform X2 n=1 Tax=Miscanthus floridulus TaxID=154761 RepID=UPI00345AD13F
MIASSLLPLRSVFVLPSSAASRSRPATATLLPVPRISLSRRFAASATESSSEEEEAAARSTNGSLPGLPPVEEEEEEFCPVDCVTEFKTDEEFQRHLERSKATGALVVVDFYRPSCGSCKYIEKGFIRLCKGSGDDGSPVVFLKHNVRDRRVRRAVGGGGPAAHQDRAALPLLQGRRAGGVVRDEGQGEDPRRHPEVHLGRART